MQHGRTAPRPADVALARGLARLPGVADLAVESLCIFLLVAAVGIALTQVFFRYVLNASLSWPEEAARWAFVWLVFVGMAVTTSRRGHIAIGLLATLLPEGVRRWHAFLIHLVVAAASVLLVRHGIDLVQRSSYVSPALGMPFTWLYAAIPVGAALNLVHLARLPVEGFASRLAGPLACLGGAALYLALTPLAALVLPAGAMSVGLVGSVVLLILLGVPVAFALALGTFLALNAQGALFVVILPQYMTAALDSFLLLAIPFFILAAGVMNAGGITTRLVELATSLVGHLRGGLGQVNVATNTMMAGISGSSMADAAAIAKALVPAMAERGYPRAFGCALTSASAVLANLIPPSLGLIIYGALASVSIGALFVAALVPGFLMAATLALVVYLVSLARGYGADTPRAAGRERLAALGRALPALALPVLIVGGVRFGVFTATEAGAMAIVYALLCGAFVYRSLRPAGLALALREALHDTIAVMVIIAAASPFAWVLVTEQVPQRLAAQLAALTADPVALLLLINLFLLLVGLIMEMIAAMVILVPILLPIVTAVGVDPVHFGIVLVVNLVIGALTPPLGMLVFTTARVGEVEVAHVFRAVIPFVLGLLAVLLLVTYLPGLSLTLTRILRP